MKNSGKLFLLWFTVAGLSACDHSVATETTVNEDGSLVRRIEFLNKDTLKNIFTLHDEDTGPLQRNGKGGWKRNVKLASQGGKEKIWKTTWEKSYPSASAATEDMGAASDSAFRISSILEKKFRWFYTYTQYCDIYHSLNKMKLPITDYITREDSAFVERLPAEGGKISRADSLYLKHLNEKLSDLYLERAFFEEYFALHLQLLADNKAERRWSDTLNRHKEQLFKSIDHDNNLDDEFLVLKMEQMGIPLPYPEIRKTFKAFSSKLGNKIGFIGTADAGKYVHRINLPGTVVWSNADSVVGNHLFWKPPVSKFQFMDYKMIAETRKANFWAFILSGMVILAAVVVLVKRR